MRGLVKLSIFGEEHFVQTVSLNSPCAHYVQKPSLPGKQKARDKEDIVMADLLCVVFQMYILINFLSSTVNTPVDGSALVSDQMSSDH